MSTRLFLVRHAETSWAAQPRLHGQSDPALSDRGCQQAKSLADALAGRQVRAIYTSPLQRAVQTGTAIAARHDLEPRVEPAFREIGLGAWEGRTIADLEADSDGRYRAWLTAPAEVKPPGGETMEEAQARVSPALAALHARHPDETVVLVTHSIVGRIVIADCLGTGLGLVTHLKLKVASISVLRLEESGGVMERMGDVSHLKTIQTSEKLSRSGWRRFDLPGRFVAANAAPPCWSSAAHGSSPINGGGADWWEE